MWHISLLEQYASQRVLENGLAMALEDSNNEQNNATNVPAADPLLGCIRENTAPPPASITREPLERNTTASSSSGGTRSRIYRSRAQAQGFRQLSRSSRSSNFAVQSIRRGSSEWQQILRPFVADLAFKSLVHRRCVSKRLTDCLICGEQECPMKPKILFVSMLLQVSK